MDLYDVAILGFRLNSREPPEQGLARVFGIDRAAARGMLKSFPLVVKAAVSEDIANSLREQLVGIGARAEVRPHQTQPLKPVQAPKPVVVAAPVPAPQPAPVLAPQPVPAPQPAPVARPVAHAVPPPAAAPVARGPMHTVLERAPLDRALLEAQARRASAPHMTLHEIRGPQVGDTQHDFVDLPTDSTASATARTRSAQPFSFEDDLPSPPSLAPDDWGPSHASNRAAARPSDPFVDLDKELSAVEREFSAVDRDFAAAEQALELALPVRAPAPAPAPAPVPQKTSNAFSDDLALPLDELPPIDAAAQARAARKVQPAAKPQAPSSVPSVPGRELPLEVQRELSEDSTELAARYVIPMILLPGSVLWMMVGGVSNGIVATLLALLITPVWVAYAIQRGRLAAALVSQRDLDVPGFLAYLRGYDAWTRHRGFVHEGVYRERGTGALQSVYRHEREPAFLAVRAAGRSAEWLLVSAFDREQLLTTSSVGIALPPPERTICQAFVGQPLEHLANAHFEAQEGTASHLQPLKTPPPYVELHAQLLERQRASLAQVPLWPLRLLSWRLFGRARQSSMG